MESLINDLSRMKKELESLQPEDRMSLLVAVNRAVAAIGMSAGGWQQFLSDIITLEKFDQATLKGFFDYFRQEAIRQLEFDLKTLTEHAQVIGASLPSQVTRRPRVAYG
jgi:hypothetical protein